MAFREYRLITIMPLWRSIVKEHDNFSDDSYNYAMIVKLNMLAIAFGTCYTTIAIRNDLLPFSLIIAFVYVLVGICSMVTPLIINYKKYRDLKKIVEVTWLL
ncbi:hypothetical protein AAEX28_09360 [Lentisphaerota bacterium WC36G]|nr:hypothetical protein LJT99_12200 [Lentisphaerae bacterium WC36]